MAHIAFYDVTPQDRKSFEPLETGHAVSFIAEPLDTSNIIGDAEVLSIFVSSRVTPEILDQFPNLKLIVCRSTGFNNVPMDKAAERGIVVTNVPTYGEHTVAEYAFGLLLSLTRRLPEAFADIQDGYGAHAHVRGMDVFGKTLGVIGSGRIGCQVAKIANAFGMQVVAFDVSPNEERAAEFGFRYVSMDELLEQSDVVTLHTFYTPENYHLINTDQLARMKPSAYLINTARGELVNTKALINALQDGKLKGAALDVLEGEALLMTPEEIALLRADTLDPQQLQHSLEINILKKMPNVLITQHNAFNTTEAIERINSTARDNIEAYLHGEIKNEVH